MALQCPASCPHCPGRCRKYEGHHHTDDYRHECAENASHVWT
jgi:hypothetical protein